MAGRCGDGGPAGRPTRSAPGGHCADTYLPGPQDCTYGLRLPASCVLYVLEAQGGLPPGAPRTVRTPYAYQPRACRTYRVPWYHRRSTSPSRGSSRR
eukprot:scaffold42696_cov57-Phaeocystis_antarctica.AAC.3